MIKRAVTPPSWSEIALLLLVGLVAVSFLYSPGTEDVGTWHSWIDEISSYGLIGGYAHNGLYPHDYPPLTFVILAAVTRCADVFGMTEFLTLKCSLLLFLLATSTCFYWFTRNRLLTSAFGFTLLLNSVALGYLDIYFAPFLIAGLFHLQRGNLNRGVFLFAISCMIKWQPLIIAPFICIYVLSTAKESPKCSKLQMRILPFAVATVACAGPILAVFGTQVIYSLEWALTYPYLSGNALNLGWLHTYALHFAQPEKYGALRHGLVDYIVTDETLLKLPEKILFYSSYSLIFIVFARQEKTFERLITYSLLGYMSYFIFNTGVHENHLFLVSCLAWILVFVNSDHLLRCINLSIATNANLLLFYGVFGQPLPLGRVVAGVDITLWFAIANICLFAGLLFHTFKVDGVRLRFWQTSRPATLSR
jgi:hypothetical protein